MGLLEFERIEFAGKWIHGWLANHLPPGACSMSYWEMGATNLVAFEAICLFGVLAWGQQTAHKQ